MKIFKRRNFIFQEVKEQQNKLILDVGSGSNPRSDATHLCDLHVSSNNEREGNLLIDNRPFIRCSVEYLPFKEDAFAFAYASHVLEHTLHPNLALAEITRVAKTGYIESPTYLAEIIYGWSFHNCAVDFKNGKILFYRNPSSQKIIDMHYISKKIIPVRIFDYLLDCILGWHFLRIIWKKTATGTTFKRIILRNPYKCLLIYKKHKGAHYSDLGIYFKNL
jgi:SAM-dependent methyltransferase